MSATSAQFQLTVRASTLFGRQRSNLTGRFRSFPLTIATDRRECNRGRRYGARHSDAEQCIGSSGPVSAHHLSDTRGVAAGRRLESFIQSLRRHRLLPVRGSGESHALDTGDRFGRGRCGLGNKSQPVIGMWGLELETCGRLAKHAVSLQLFIVRSDTAQRATPTAHRLPDRNFRLPRRWRADYRYHARILYGDQVNPARASVAGGTALAIQGLGFQSNLRGHRRKRERAAAGGFG